MDALTRIHRLAAEALANPPAPKMADTGVLVEICTICEHERKEASRAPSLQDAVCGHGTAMDVHCCGCHTGFIFDKDHECPQTPLEIIHEIGVMSMTAQSDPHAKAKVYRQALIDICDVALKAQETLHANAELPVVRLRHMERESLSHVRSEGTEREIETATPAAVVPQDVEAATCADCGTSLNAGEAKCFTVCDACWAKVYPPKPVVSDPPTGWQPIATALRDGTEILLTDGHYKRTGYFAKRIAAWSIDMVPPLKMPTHWASLPGEAALRRASEVVSDPLTPLIAECAVILEALHLSVEWELAPPITKAIADLVPKLRAALRRAAGKA